MKVALLRQAALDLRWFELYYVGIFPEGSKKAARQYLAAIGRLSEMPYLGHPTDIPLIREFTIARTPFSLIYRIADEEIEVVRVWDGRKDRGENWLNG